MGRLRAISQASWASVFRVIRPPKDPSAVTREFQKKVYSNTDTLVACLEFTILVLSAVQLDISSRSSRWRENRACDDYPGCTEMHDEGSFLAPNCIRSAIAVLGFVRLWVRVRFMMKQRLLELPSKSWLGHWAKARGYVLEVLYTVIFPYPGLESFISRQKADILIILSISVGFRTVCWQHLLYFPYPIRRKEKVASFSGNLEFTYREFAIKKVLDDAPMTKIMIFFVSLMMNTTFLVHVIETIHGECVWEDDSFRLGTLTPYFHFVCSSMSWENAFWLVMTTFCMLGYGDLLPKSGACKVVIAVAACAIRFLTALLTSVVIKKLQFNSMEARVNAFLFRMGLFNKKDLSAVIAVQATFRFNKSYKRSLMWHKHENSQLYYRPLSARLPDELKKKLYVSRFQTSLKEIMKFNTDGDPLNAFTKHIEVITAALGITLVEMAQLKKVYYRKSRILEERRTLVNTTSFKQPSSPPRPPTEDEHKETETSSALVETASPSRGDLQSQKSTPVVVTPKPKQVSDEWGHVMLNRCEDILARLQHIEISAKRFEARDRRGSIQRRAA
ncbi:hypothetical protein Poli38472_006190 [Pythium oligandrum]|uniref:Potassium channel domain-containing protein n=1 Tax=Pythium oligandrum TaxID=41045 RepID=A0A8K1CRW5_PYTOL|nr:hypothetical protein Poli38472_006190 [Pythium oligandrum]|eukprot:TMW68722.1 hypothetical protein Poli38472_006190 [Pythium oligandrum]